MTNTCAHCRQRRWIHARALCKPCYRTHHDEYPRKHHADGPLVCECATPDPEPVGGLFNAVGATQCARCYRLVPT